MPSSAYSVQRQPQVIPAGQTGATGPTGPGVPASGASGSVLRKNSATDYDTGWATLATVAADTAFTDRFGLSGAGAPGGTGVQGQWYWDTTNKREYLSDGVGWIVMAEPATTTFAPVITSLTGTLTTVGAVTFSYRRHDGWLDWVESITITTNGTGATAIRTTLPIAMNVLQNIGSGRETGLTGSAVTVTAGTTSAGDIFTYNNAYPGGTGAILQVRGQYQMTTRYS